MMTFVAFGLLKYLNTDMQTYHYGYTYWHDCTVCW